MTCRCINCFIELWNRPTFFFKEFFCLKIAKGWKYLSIQSSWLYALLEMSQQEMFRSKSEVYLQYYSIRSTLKHKQQKNWEILQRNWGGKGSFSWKSVIPLSENLLLFVTPVVLITFTGFCVSLYYGFIALIKNNLDYLKEISLLNFKSYLFLISPEMMR